MIATGKHGVYDWLVTDEFVDLPQICPQVFVGKYVAITSIDSWPLFPSDEDLAAGWQTREKIAYSPKLRSPEDLPLEGWDEWYIFEKLTDLGISLIGENIFEMPQQRGHVSVFVNYNLALHRPDMEDLASLFWQQLEWIQPESYVAINDYLNFVSSDKNLFTAVHAALKR